MPMVVHAAFGLVNASAAALTAGTLLQADKQKRFRAIAGYLLISTCIEVALALIDPRSPLYFWSYLVLEPLKCVSSILAVRELITESFHDYPGLRVGGRRIMYAGVAFGLLLALASTFYFWNSTEQGRNFSHLYYLEVAQNSVVLSLAVVILTMDVFLSRYPVQLSRIGRVCALFFSLVFLSETAALILDLLQPHLSSMLVDRSEQIFIVSCLLLWAYQLRFPRAAAPVAVKFQPVDEDRLLRELNALNQVLARATRVF